MRSSPLTRTFGSVSLFDPNAPILGSDYVEDEIVGADIVKANGGSISRLDLRHGHSTSVMVAKSRTPERTAG